ncbi:hypothetical protein AZH46_09630 [Corynebacterium striatum]|nr:hypothetical protein AZH46_09630 [Corynebacterium striatum]
MKVDRPTPRASAWESVSVATPADWVKRPVRPARGIGAGVVLSRTSGSVLMMPNEAGPRARSPWSRAARTTAREASPARPGFWLRETSTTPAAWTAEAASMSGPGSVPVGGDNEAAEDGGVGGRGHRKVGRGSWSGRGRWRGRRRR